VLNLTDHETLDFAGLVKQDPFAPGDQFSLQLSHISPNKSPDGRIRALKGTYVVEVVLNLRRCWVVSLLSALTD
jgi:hypothetical protein